MKILLMSDTHSYIDDQILKYVHWSDEVWHAGDIGDEYVITAIQHIKPCRAVYGNIDSHQIRLSHPLNQIFIIEGVSVFMTHIGGYPNKYTARVLEEIKKCPPTLFISGHSHILKVQYDSRYKLLHMNPGACGKHGFHQVRTLLRFEIENGEIKNLEVVELGKR